jgi:hypothetical protein
LLSDIRSQKTIFRYLSAPPYASCIDGRDALCRRTLNGARKQDRSKSKGNNNVSAHSPSPRKLSLCAPALLSIVGRGDRLDKIALSDKSEKLA